MSGVRRTVGKSKLEAQDRYAYAMSLRSEQDFFQRGYEADARDVELVEALVVCSEEIDAIANIEKVDQN